jgi:hypothetical protein
MAGYAQGDAHGLPLGKIAAGDQRGETAESEQYYEHDALHT